MTVLFADQNMNFFTTEQLVDLMAIKGTTSGDLYMSLKKWSKGWIFHLWPERKQGLLFARY